MAVLATALGVVAALSAPHISGRPPATAYIPLWTASADVSVAPTESQRSEATSTGDPTEFDAHVAVAVGAPLLPEPRSYLTKIVANLMCGDAGCCTEGEVVNFTVQAVNPIPVAGSAPCGEQGAAPPSGDPLRCVAGFYTPGPAAAARPCPTGRFCPADYACMMGCLEGQTCPAPLSYINSSTPCSMGRNVDNVTLCPGTGTVVACPEGSFCPTRADPVECPRGSFCRGGSEHPQVCPLLADCPAGSADNLVNFTLELVIVVVALCILVGLRLTERGERLRQRRVKYSAPTWAEVERVSSIRQKSFNQLCLLAENPSGPAPLLSPVPPRAQGTAAAAPERVRWHMGGGHSADDLAASGGEMGSPLNTPDVDIPDDVGSTAFTCRPGLNGYAAVPRPPDPHEIPVRNAAPIEIKFEHLGLTLKSDPGRTIIKNVTGTFSPRSVAAIMGPSGAGKTSLLNVILDRAYYGNVGGRVLINGQERKLRDIRHDVGFVPQDDVMHASLTVREVLTYQAELRLPPSWTRRQILALVRETIEMLELEEIADTRVGDIQTRGISGGQRKRVNIGMELVADPLVLVLDEPTSGLDSTSGLRVVEALQKAAHVKGLTVVTVLHQPRYEIFNCFDRLLLLGPGGTTCFEGKTRLAVKHFSKLGYRLPHLMNPADFLMDVVSGVIQGGESQSLAGKWMAESAYDVKPNFSTASTTATAGSINGDDRHPEAAYQADGLLGSRRRVRGFWSQLLTLSRRNMLLAARSAKLLFLDMFLTLLGAVALGGSHLKADQTGTFYSMYTLSAIVLGITTVISSTRVLGSHQEVYFREASSGLNRAAHFLAANLVHLPFLLVNSLVYMEALYTLTMPRGGWASQYALVWTAVFATSGLGYMVSMLFNPGSFQMAAAVIVLISSMLDGANPTRTSSTLSNPFGKFLLSISFARWLAEATVEMEFAAIPDVFFGQIEGSGAAGLAGDIVHFGVHPNSNPLPLSCSVLVGFGVATRVASFFFMVTFNRGKQR